MMRGGIAIDRFKKLIVAAIVIIYVISPTDAIPGPVDDMLVMLLGWAMSRRLAKD